MSHLDLRFPVFQRDCQFELVFYSVLGLRTYLDVRFPVFLRGGRFETIKYNVSEPWTISTDACAAKSPTRNLGTFFFCCYFMVSGPVGEPLKEGDRKMEEGLRT